MSLEQLAALITAIAALIAALAGLSAQIGRYHAAVNGRMDELLEVTRQSAHAKGKLEESEARPDNA